MIEYRSKVATRRWPMVVFYDRQRGVQHTNVLWLFKNPRWYEKKHGQRRRLFLHELGNGYRISTATHSAASCIDGITVRHTVSY